MCKYEFSLTRVLLYEDRIYDSAIIRENKCQRKLVFSRMYLHSVLFGDFDRIREIDAKNNRLKVLTQGKNIFAISYPGQD